MIGALVAAYVLLTIALGVVLRWEDERTVGLRYYGLRPEARERFKRRLQFFARLLAPILWLNGRMATLDFRRARIQHKGVSAPTGSCSVESFTQAEAYRPRPEDVFVVTQMKCGTTWMQHVVYEVIHRGNGTLVDSGTAMYAVSPWLEGRKSVSIDEAPLLGSAPSGADAEVRSRIIKTHLPVSICPFDPAAKYVYVARHPLSCFASCIDFVVTNVGAMAPPMEKFEEWYCSADLMWWGTWTDHVKGWWQRSRERDNVLFVFFEDMKRDLPSVVRQVAAFLGVAPLSDEELGNVVHKCSFAYMQEHQEAFEMHPPHILQSSARLFVSGSAERHKDVPDEVRRRVAAWAAREMASSDFPLADAYPDVATSR